MSHIDRGGESVLCPSCGNDNRPEAKFCAECGSKLALVCPNGHSVAASARVCDESGAAVGGTARAPATAGEAPAPATEPSAERRMVSVLFTDLVGFTTFSEGRDAEDVREMLGRYFDAARRLVALYGGTIEKFIGDAVMAVWGTPVAQADDAERAVRAALDLTAAVAELGAEAGTPDLRARAGVLTGEAAVTLGAEGQGMVAGDLVNTASRIQSAAQPGAVFVGESTRRATEAAVVYEDAGTHDMKGKAEPVPLWRALRVVAGRGGAQKATNLEAPFVGRDRELRLMKELLHGSAEDGRAHLVSVIGIAGIGKSRLAWEFEKYVDGLVKTYRWHRGRCLAYGEGVTYWALAEMVRMRADIVEGEGQTEALAKLRASIETYVTSAEEREWIEPRLSHLLGLEERTARDAEDLFGAWRLFFERISNDGPVILLFEDMQWADQSLVDFVDYLMNWSKNHPIFVVVQGRPEFLDKHPGWGAGRRGATTLSLDPLSQEAMDELLAGLVPGLPDATRAQILDRAQGVPLYAVETVRMLLDRGLLAVEGSVYRPTGPIEDLEVPETLQALIAARLDGLDPAERRLIQDAAVVGKTFTKASLAAITSLPEEEIERMLASLLRKELLSIQADPRSPERGQYGFLQDLVRRVAYETLSRKDRKARHLAAAAWLEKDWGSEEDEVVEVVASHYLDAYQAVPDAADAPEIKGKALDALVQAGRRAASLAATHEARRYYERAIELADDPIRRAELHERAGHMARLGLKVEEAGTHFATAVELFTSAGKTHPAARASAHYARIIRLQGRGEEAMEQMQAALAVLSAEEPDADLAILSQELARVQVFYARYDEAMENVERALTIAESEQLPEVLAEALNTKHMILGSLGRPEEALVLLQHALKVALENDLSEAALRAYNNIGASMYERDRHGEEFEITKKIAELGRRVGNRFWERQGVAGGISADVWLGRWRDALASYADLRNAEDWETQTRPFLVEMALLPFLHVQRGDLSSAREFLEIIEPMRGATDVGERSLFTSCEGWVRFGEGRFSDALAAGKDSLEEAMVLGPRNPQVKEGLALMTESAFVLNDAPAMQDALDYIRAGRPGTRSPYIDALEHRLSARWSIARDDDDGEIETEFRKAIETFRTMEAPFWIGAVALDLGTWLLTRERETDAKPLLDEANEIFSTLEAKPWLERLDAVRQGPVASTGTRG